MIQEKEGLKKIGSKLKELRIKKGFGSYEKFAIEYEISRMQYWRIEEGKTNITFRTLISILNIHDISLKDFFSDGI